MHRFEARHLTFGRERLQAEQGQGEPKDGISRTESRHGGMLIRCPCTVQAFAWTDGQRSPGFDRFASSIATLDIELSPKEAYACRRPEDPSTC